MDIFKNSRHQWLGKIWEEFRKNWEEFRKIWETFKDFKESQYFHENLTCCHFRCLEYLSLRMNQSLSVTEVNEVRIKYFEESFMH